MKNKNNYSRVKQYPFVIAFDSADKVYVAKALDLKGCHTDGKTPEEAVKNIYEAMQGWMETAEKNGISIPQPSLPQEKTKKFPLRLASQNALKLEWLSSAKHTSINSLINEAVANL